MKFSIIIPIYNEKPTTAVLIDQVLGVSLDGVEKEIIIVEGASTDGTREVVRGYERQPEVRIIYEDRPQGKGAAVRRGLAAASGDIILIQDGDLEYDVSDYSKLLAPLLAGSADVVFGSRSLEHKQRWQYRQFKGFFERIYGFIVNWGGLFYTILFNFLYGTRLTDGATMFKLFRAADLKGITLKSSRFDYDWELSAKLAKRGRRFMEVPVYYKARSRSEGKKIRFWRDGWLVLRAILRYRFTD